MCETVRNTGPSLTSYAIANKLFDSLHHAGVGKARAPSRRGRLVGAAARRVELGREHRRERARRRRPAPRELSRMEV